MTAPAGSCHPPGAGADPGLSAEAYRGYQMPDQPRIREWPAAEIKGSKRTHVSFGEFSDWDWFVGWGKGPSCQFEGSWWDMICFARNVLASENTRIAAPEFHRPEWANENYTGPSPYQFGDKED